MTGREAGSAWEMASRAGAMGLAATAEEVEGAGRRAMKLGIATGPCGYRVRYKVGHEVGYKVRHSHGTLRI